MKIASYVPDPGWWPLLPLAFVLLLVAELYRMDAPDQAFASVDPVMCRDTDRMFMSEFRYDTIPPKGVKSVKDTGTPLVIKITGQSGNDTCLKGQLQLDTCKVAK